MAGRERGGPDLHLGLFAGKELVKKRLSVIGDEHAGGRGLRPFAGLRHGQAACREPYRVLVGIRRPARILDPRQDDRRVLVLHREEQGSSQAVGRTRAQLHQAGRNGRAFTGGPGVVLGSRRAVRRFLLDLADRRRGIADGGRSLRPGIRHPEIFGVLADVSEGLTDSPGCLIGRVAGLDRLPAGPERIDLGLQPLASGGEPLFLAPQVAKLMAKLGQLLLDTCLPCLRVAGQVLPSGLQRALGLSGELRRSLLQLTDLQLQALARGRHVGDAAAYRCKISSWRP